MRARACSKTWLRREARGPGVWEIGAGRGGDGDAAGGWWEFDSGMVGVSVAGVESESGKQRRACSYGVSGVQEAVCGSLGIWVWVLDGLCSTRRAGHVLIYIELMRHTTSIFDCFLVVIFR